MRYPVLLFDLFRTLLLFTRDAPTGQVREATWRPAMRALRDRAQPLLGAVDFDAFLDALYDASLEVAQGRPPEHRETPIAVRYQHALARLGFAGEAAAQTAARLAHLQLEAQAAHTELPAAHLPLLRELARQRRLAVVSNFDDGPTVHRLLARHGLDQVLSAVVISIEVDRRKPHPEIFHAALRRLEATPAEALMIGDSLRDDIAGAAAAGIASAWLNWDGAALPAGGPQPTHVLRALGELRELLS